MVTNQTGIARGYFSEETLHATNARMQGELAAAGARLDGAYVCMHHPSEGQPPYRADCDAASRARACCIARRPSSTST